MYPAKSNNARRFCNVTSPVLDPFCHINNIAQPHRGAESTFEAFFIRYSNESFGALSRYCGSYNLYMRDTCEQMTTASRRLWKRLPLVVLIKNDLIFQTSLSPPVTRYLQCVISIYFRCTKTTSPRFDMGKHRTYHQFAVGQIIIPDDHFTAHL